MGNAPGVDVVGEVLQYRQDTQMGRSPRRQAPSVPNERMPLPIRWGDVFGDDVVAAAMIRPARPPRRSHRPQRRQLPATQQRPRRPPTRGHHRPRLTNNRGRWLNTQPQKLAQLSAAVDIDTPTWRKAPAADVPAELFTEVATPTTPDTGGVGGRGRGGRIGGRRSTLVRPSTTPRQPPVPRARLPPSGCRRGGGGHGTAS